MTNPHQPFDHEKEMRRRAETKARFCRHFNGLVNDRCDAGIAYLSVKGAPKDSFRSKYPCCDNDSGATCERCVKPTLEEARREVDAEEVEIGQSLAAMRKAHEHAASQGLGRGKGGNGQMPCPKCGTGTLHYRVASINGHMHANCTTPKCLAWME